MADKDLECELESVPCTAVALQGTQLVDSSGGTGGVWVALALGSSDGEGERSAQLLWTGSMTGGVIMRGRLDGQKGSMP